MARILVMSTEDRKSRFRVTAIGLPFTPEPLVAVGTVRIVSEVVVEFPPLEMKRIPRETYLRDVTDLDLTSAAVIEEFCGRYGIPVFQWPDLPEEFVRPLATRPSDGERSGQTWSDEDQEELLKIARRFGAPHQELDLQGVREGIKVVRDLTRLALGRAASDRVRKLPGDWESAIVPRPSNWTEGMLILTEFLSAALRTLHPAIKIEGHKGSDVWGLEGVTTYRALCLQIANDLMSDHAYKQCANPDCGRSFIFQRGRARQGQERASGTKYCSAECAHVMASRSYRDRKRKQRSSSHQ
jgi:hypothetical protein